MLTPTEVLDIPMEPTENGANASSVREYFMKLALAVWEEADEFSGKRPFGDSDWYYDVYDALMDAGAVEFTLDEDEEVRELKYPDRVDDMISDAIRAMA